MKKHNPFDEKITAQGTSIPWNINEAARRVVDTLDLAWVGAQTVFEDQAKPEHALKILELILLESKKLSE